jgi:hypothetical protein
VDDKIHLVEESGGVPLSVNGHSIVMHPSIGQALSSGGIHNALANSTLDLPVRPVVRVRDQRWHVKFCQFLSQAVAQRLEPVEMGPRAAPCIVREFQNLPQHIAFRAQRNRGIVRRKPAAFQKARIRISVHMTSDH